MHPGSTTPNGKVERHSLTDGGLEGIYSRYQDLANVGGGSAKDVGTDRASTDAINGGPASQAATRDWAQKDFKIKQPVRVTQFTDGGLNYSTNTLKLDNTKYAPGGRLP
jgi:hypothetical protein